MITEKHLLIFGEIPTTVENDVVLDITTNNITASTHGFHKYPAKFIPHVPRWAITKYLGGLKNQIVLDPFCGSGTTLVEGILHGHNVVGIDIDPLSALISKVKTTPLDKKYFDEVYHWMLVRIQDDSAPSAFMPRSINLQHWFTPEAINKLSRIRTAIDTISDEFQNIADIIKIKNLFIIAFSSIIRRVSNADNESQKTYVSHTNKKTPEDAIPLFLKQIKIYHDRIIEFSENTDSSLSRRIVITDSTKALSNIVGEIPPNLAVTSPPYIKAIDYIYNQMVELFWIGDLFELETQEKQNLYKKKYTGSKHFHLHDYRSYSPYDMLTNIPGLDEKLQKIFSTDKKNGHKHSYLTYKYFQDMDLHFRQMRHILSRNAHYIMVVGDSNVSNIYFETADIISRLAYKNGFTLANRWAYKIKNRYMRFDRKGRGGIITLDWVLDFVRND